MLNWYATCSPVKSVNLEEVLKKLKVWSASSRVGNTTCIPEAESLLVVVARHLQGVCQGRFELSMDALNLRSDVISSIKFSPSCQELNSTRNNTLLNWPRRQNRSKTGLYDNTRPEPRNKPVQEPRVAAWFRVQGSGFRVQGAERFRV